MGLPLPLAWLRRCHAQRWSGRTCTVARQALQDELRRQRGDRTEVLRPESRFRDAADVWMAKIRERRADSTDTCASCLKNQVLPHPGELRLVEVATLEYVDWFNHWRLHSAAADLPPAELEAAHYRPGLGQHEPEHSTR